MPFVRRDLRNARCKGGNDLAEHWVNASEQAKCPLDKEGAMPPGSNLIATILEAS